MELIVIISIAFIAVIHVLFSKPKATTDVIKKEGRGSSIYCSSIRNSYPPTQEIFKTIKDANISPCFSGRHRNEES